MGSENQDASKHVLMQSILPSGLYICVLRTPSTEIQRTMTIVNKGGEVPITKRSCNGAFFGSELPELKVQSNIKLSICGREGDLTFSVVKAVARRSCS